MFNKVKVTLCAVSLSLLASSAFCAHQFQTMVWKHIPLNISLPVGSEKIIHFPHSADLGIPSSINQDLTTQRQDGWMYITANKAFKPVRVEVRDNVTGQMILLNLSASKTGNTHNVTVIYPNKKASNGKMHPLNTGVMQGSMAYKTMTQYAEQQLYAPKRLLKNPYGISLIKSYAINGSVPKSQWLYHFFIGGGVVAQPWASWYGGNVYVTAVLIKNLLASPLNLRRHLTSICGRISGVWKAVTYFPFAGKPWVLGRAGSESDHTVAFLISREPFSQAIAHCGDKE